MLGGGWVERFDLFAVLWGSVVLETSLKATAVLAITAIGLQLAHRAAATVRHAVWFASITSPFALVLLACALPRWHVEVPLVTTTRWLADAFGPMTNNTQGLTSAASQNEDRVIPLSEIGNRDFSEVTSGSLLQQTVRPAAHHHWKRRSTWGLAFTIWLIGMGVLAARQILAHMHLWVIWRGSVACDDRNLNLILRECASRFELERVVALRLSKNQCLPMVCGIVQSTIILPAEATSWRQARVRSVLQHELAHVVRRDCLTSQVAYWICIFNWFNPFLWGVLRMINTEREHACDDLVLHSGQRPSTYAEHLLSVAAHRPTRWSPTAGLAMARQSQLEGRLRAILDPRRNRRLPTRSAGVFGMTLMILMLIPLASVSTSVAVAKPVQPDASPQERREQSIVDPIGRADLEDWTPDSLLDALRASDSQNRHDAEAACRAMGAEHPTIEAVVDRLVADIASGDANVRKQSAWLLAKTRGTRALEALVGLLDDNESQVRAAAAGALGETGDARALEALDELSADRDAGVREWSARALGNFHAPEAEDSLIGYMRDSAPGVREWAARGLSNFKDPGAFEALAVALTDSSASVREWAARSLGDFGDPASVAALISALDDDSADVREWAARSLGNIGSSDAIVPLSRTLHDKSATVREWSARALGNIGDAAAAQYLADALSDKAPGVRASSARALGYVGGANVVNPLLTAVWDDNGAVRQFAAQALGHIGDARAVDGLAEILDDNDVDVRDSAVQALKQIGTPEAIHVLYLHGLGGVSERSEVDGR